MYEIIGITGKAGSGKDTVARFILENPAFSHFKVRSFAGPLKEVVCALTGCSMKDLENPDFKKKEVPGFPPIYEMEYKKTFKKSDLFIPNIKERPCTYRDLLQYIGTDMFKDKFGADFWINRLKIDSDTIITDVRFPEEADFVESNGGTLISISRPGDRGIVKHVSEDLKLVGDYHIDNTGTLEDLKERVQNILERL